MVTHIAAVTVTIAIYLLMGVAYYGWGIAGSAILGPTRGGPRSVFMLVWLGWALTLFIFETSHFFLPVTAYLVVPIFGFGLILSYINIRREPPRSVVGRPDKILMVAAAGLTVAFAFWVASKAMLPPANFDSGLYHLNTIRWINSHSVIPGLGNLHGRLAFNQSFFTYVAALNFYPYFGYGRSLANSFLLMLVFTMVLASLRPVLRQPSLLKEAHPFTYLPSIFMLPVIGYLALYSNGVASPTPDLASTLIQLAMFLMLTRGIADWIKGRRDQHHFVTVLVFLAATAITIKLSNLAFSAVIIGFGIAYVWQTSRLRFRSVFQTLLPVSVLMFVWGLNGFILSGAPLYPSTVGYTPVSWAVPEAEVTDMANWVYSWARQPDTDWHEVLGSWDWLKPWTRNIRSRHILDIMYPLSVSITFIALTAVIALSKKGARPRYSEAAILLPPIIGLIYWFFTAPNPKFTNALLFLLSISSALLFLVCVRGIIEGRRFAAAVLIVVFAVNRPFAIDVFAHTELLKSISTSGWIPVQKVPLKRKVTASGLVLYMPEIGYQCWDAPLPSTPYFNDKLRLIKPNDLSSGFAVNGPSPGN